MLPKMTETNFGKNLFKVQFGYLVCL